MWSALGHSLCHCACEFSRGSIWPNVQPVRLNIGMEGGRLRGVETCHAQACVGTVEGWGAHRQAAKVHL